MVNIIQMNILFNQDQRKGTAPYTIEKVTVLPNDTVSEWTNDIEENKIVEENNVIDEIDFTEAEERHAFNDIYETILKDLQSAGKSGRILQVLDLLLHL